MRIFALLFVCLVAPILCGCAPEAPAPTTTAAPATSGSEPDKPRNSMMGEPPAEAP